MSAIIDSKLPFINNTVKAFELYDDWTAEERQERMGEDMHQITQRLGIDSVTCVSRTSAFVCERLLDTLS